MAAVVTASLVTGLVSDVAVTADYAPPLAQTTPVPYTEVPLAQHAATVDSSNIELKDTSWPGAGRARTSGGRAGELPVTVTSKRRNDFDVEVLGQDVSRRIGLTGVVVAVKPADTSKDEMSVGLDYSGFRNAVGANFGVRLRFTRLPDCALTSPDVATCRQQTPLPSKNDPEKLTVNTEFNAAEPMVLAVTAAAAGAEGSFAASSLAPSGSWSVEGNSGSFSWSYPIGLPPSAAGSAVAPKIALSYDSSTVDGRTAATNNQSSWIGQGWDIPSSFIERTYRACGEDKTLPEAQQTGDLCWAGQIVTMSLGGKSTALVLDDDTHTWHAASDDGARVELLSGAHNGVHDGEHWKVTTTNGIAYYFGLNRGPGYTNQDETDSAWTVPVYGPRPGDPCYASSGFADSKCDQAWRWNLDFVEDTHGNVTSYYYTPETNYYGTNFKTVGVPYTRGGVLERIDYGLRKVNGSIYGQVAPNQVVFDTSERCVPKDAVTCDPSQFTKDNAKQWPDTPQDQDCDAGATCDNHSPSFWSTKRLKTITTRYDQGAGPVKVDRYELGHEFKDIGDKELWLQSITRTGFAADGTSLSTPPITFTGQMLDNRVKGYNNMPALAHWRVTNIATDTGSSINVFYSPPDCTATTVPTDLTTNTTRCYPVYWTLPFNQDPILDYFHKYVVDKVEVQDRNGLSPTQMTSYAYLDGAAWHFDDNELVKPEHRTYGQYRGYGKVETRTGNTANAFDNIPDRRTLSRATYFQGMEGDSLPNGGHRTGKVVHNSLGESYEDNNLYAGIAYEVESFNGDGGTKLSSAIVEPFVVDTTASRSRTDLPALTANMVAPRKNRTIASLADGGTRTKSETSRYDDIGRAVARTDSGTGVPDVCTTIHYADNTTSWIRDRVSEVLKSAQACPAPGVLTAPVLGAVRTYYDNQSTLGSVTGPGDSTRIDTATTNTGGSLAFQTTGTAAFDISGREISTTDALNRTSSVAYTPAVGGILVGAVATNPKGQTSRIDVEPAHGKTVASVDVGGRRTDVLYDPLGRVASVWAPGQTKGFTDPTTKFEYLLRTDGPLAVTSKSLVDYGTGTNFLVKVELYDGLGKLRQTQSDAADGSGRVVADVFYDSHGWVRASNNRYLATGAPTTTMIQVAAASIDDRTVNDYDGSGRVVVETSYRGLTPTWNTKTVHGGDRTTVIPPRGGVTTTTVADVLGRSTELREYTSAPTVDGSVVSGGSYQASTFHYNTAGQQDKMTDSVGNQWLFGYDFLGRKTSQTDPDSGVSGTTYDLAGQVETTTDARGTTLAFEYDALGRKTTEYLGSKTGTKLASWLFDGAQNGVGLPYYSTRYTPEGNYLNGVSVYDGAGKPNKLITQIPAAESGLNALYTTKFGYTSTGQLRSTEQPAGGGLNGEAIGITYNKYGLATTSTGYNAYVTGASYTPFGEPSSYTLGASNNTSRLSFDYDAQTRRTSKVTFSTQQADPQVDDTRYSYDPAGNLTKVVNTQGAERLGVVRTQCFGYDTLDRLSDAWTATDGCAAAPANGTSGVNIGGPTPYWLSWTFKPGGLRAGQVRHAVPGVTGGDTTTTYTYPAAGSPKPHTLNGTTTSGPAGTSSTGYGYDEVGNTTSRTLPTGNQTLSWDVEGRLASIVAPSGTTKYVYDADGSQLVRRDPGKTTVFLPGQELTRDTTTGTVVGTRYYTHDGATIAMRVGNTNPKFVVSDQHGTAQVLIDAESHAVTRRTMDPYGNPLGAGEGGAWPGGRGFLDKPTSTVTGLTDVGARKYDTTTGRFTSVDPLLDPSSPESWTGYTYANNNPTTFADPTGLFCDGCEYAGSGDNHGVGCSLNTDGVCGPGYAAPQYTQVYQATVSVITGQNENPALQPVYHERQLPLFSQLKALQPAGHGYGPDDSYGDAVSDWAKNICMNPGGANTEFCAGARSDGLLDPNNPKLHAAIGIAVAAAVVAMVAVECVASVVCVNVISGGLNALDPAAAAMTGSAGSGVAVVTAGVAKAAEVRRIIDGVMDAPKLPDIKPYIPESYGTFAKWGEEIWGSSRGKRDPAGAAYDLIGKRNGDELRAIGLDLESATLLRNFYRTAANGGRGTSTAPAREKLMNDIMDKLSR